MPPVNNRADVDRLKQMLADGWHRILESVPHERADAFGIYTNESGQSMFPFLLGEHGLKQVATKYVGTHKYNPDTAAEQLRWSTADSPYVLTTTYSFPDRQDIYELAPPAAAREAHYRLTTGCTALRELDEEGLFGTGDSRENITLYIEGGDVNREWILKWAKKLNPPTVYRRFANIGRATDTTGTFTEFGSKKVYQTRQYALSADRKLLAAATEYQLFVFDTTGLKQLFAKALPAKNDYASLGGVAISGDGKVIAVIPFGGGNHGNELFIVSGEKGAQVRTVAMKERPCAVAVSPAGNWIAVTDQTGALNLFDPNGALLGSNPGHTAWPRGIAVSPEGSTLATGDSKSLIIWNTSDWSKRHVIELRVDSLDFDPTGRQLVGASAYHAREMPTREASLINIETGIVVRKILVDGYRIEHARFSPDGRCLACAMRTDSEKYSGTNTSALVDIVTGKILNWLKADFEQVRDFAFLPHRSEIAVAVFGHTRRPLVLWQVRKADSM